MIRRRFSIETPLAPEQARTRLIEAIGPQPTSLFDRDGRPFVGSMVGSTFDMMRATRGRNSFRPRIRGSVETAIRGSEIRGTMQLHEIVLVVMAVFLGLPTMVLFSLLAGSLRSGSLDPAAPYALGVVGFLLVMMLGGFVVESRRALRDLAAIVDATRSELT